MDISNTFTHLLQIDLVGLLFLLNSFLILFTLLIEFYFLGYQCQSNALGHLLSFCHLTFLSFYLIIYNFFFQFQPIFCV